MAHETFTTINIDCQLLILKKFSLSHLVQLRAVSGKWRHLIECDIVSKKNNLRLFENYDAPFAQFCYKIGASSRGLEADFQLIRTGYCLDDALAHRGPLPREPTFPVAIFADVTTLTVYHQSAGRLLNSLMLKHNWASRVRSLTILCPTTTQQIKLMWTAIGGMTALRRLYLDETKHCAVPESVYPILQKLEHLSVDNYYGDVTTVLDQLTVHCKSLELSSCSLKPANLTQLAAKNPAFVAGLSRLSVSTIYFSLEPNFSVITDENCFNVLQCIAESFQSLEYFSATELLVGSEIFTEILPRMSKLTTLRLGYNHIAGLYWITPGLVNRETPHEPLNVLPFLELPQITHFQMYDPYDAKSHLHDCNKELYRFVLGRLMPKMKKQTISCASLVQLNQVKELYSSPVMQFIREIVDIRFHLFASQNQQNMSDYYRSLPENT